jgi:hypothetical protein
MLLFGHRSLGLRADALEEDGPGRLKEDHIIDRSIIPKAVQFQDLKSLNAEIRCFKRVIGIAMEGASLFVKEGARLPIDIEQKPPQTGCNDVLQDYHMQLKLLSSRQKTVVCWIVKKKRKRLGLLVLWGLILAGNYRWKVRVYMKASRWNMQRRYSNCNMAN